jgi:hypothetical protein
LRNKPGKWGVILDPKGNSGTLMKYKSKEPSLYLPAYDLDTDENITNDAFKSLLIGAGNLSVENRMNVKQLKIN